MSEFEASWIEIVNEKQTNVLLGCIYRHPRNTDDDFIVYMQNILEQIKKENKLVVIAGDFNLNLLKHNIDDKIKEFLNLMLSNYYQPTITQPTRFSNENRPSLVDNIFINSIEHDTYSGNIISKITDHLPNFMFINNGNQNLMQRPSIMVREFKNFDKDKFLQDLQTIENFDDAQDPNYNYEKFQNHFLKYLEKHAPLKKLMGLISYLMVWHLVLGSIYGEVHLRCKYWEFLRARGQVYNIIFQRCVGVICLRVDMKSLEQIWWQF